MGRTRKRARDVRLRCQGESVPGRRRMAPSRALHRGNEAGQGAGHADGPVRSSDRAYDFDDFTERGDDEHLDGLGKHRAANDDAWLEFTGVHLIPARDGTTIHVRASRHPWAVAISNKIISST